MKDTRQQFPNGDFPRRGREESSCRDGKKEEEGVSLPPIRTMFPDLDRDLPAELPPHAVSPCGPSSEYVYSPRQRKRTRALGNQERQLDRPSQVPRTYHDTLPTYLPTYSYHNLSPDSSRPQSPLSWSQSAFTHSTSSSPNTGGTVIRPPVISPTTIEPRERVEARRVSPPYQQFEFRIPPRTRDSFNDGYVSDPSRQPTIVHSDGHRVELGDREYHQASYDHGYHRSSRHQSLSVGPPHYESPAYPASIYRPPYGDPYLHLEELGMMPNGDPKQRKRRGNLPKHTTEILRKWFHSHLHHPYPTEDEKQDLVKQTGLQLNQISNWFINARRRQLPNLISDARAESEVIHGRGTDTTDNLARRRQRHPSDSEGSYDEIEVNSKRRRTIDMKRGSV
ncbi:hypothetical protein NPX13_g8192 [Xylaria arbuscula]|uniref:Homeobox domain-containing protein n=1 Tax=Xylaria arbuscula TaxID=114810 RepID=A0A9W8TKE3_9PEZI|nr:hypothetical protein NPX13_g8192 [Xylaria arbuscula]